jgi:hypothetical protein
MENPFEIILTRFDKFDKIEQQRNSPIKDVGVLVSSCLQSWEKCASILSESICNYKNE